MKILLTLATVLCMVAFCGCDFFRKEPVSAECDHCKDYSGDEFEGVPAGLVYTMIKQYKLNHWNNQRVLGNNQPTDARSVWFNLDTLKKFIYKIEQAACSSNCINRADLGIRFYYAEYPDIVTWNQYDNDPATLAHRMEYQGLHTLVMTPTYYNTNSQMNVDFDPRFTEYNKEKQCVPMSMRNVLNELGADIDSAGKVIGGVENTLMLSPNVRTTAKNKGSLIPPPPPAGSSNAGERKGAVLLDLVENIVHNY